MVKLTKIYTRGGDRGKTSLGDGARVAKHDLRVAAYGTVDEANAVIGLARLHSDAAADAMLATLGALVVGLAGFFHGGEFNRKYGNKLMQARVALQAVAVVLLLMLLLGVGQG